MNKDRILVIGASGQIGTVLVENLRELFGVGDVIASDLRQPQHAIANFQTLDVTDSAQLGSVIKEQKITQIYHLAAVLSANAERNPLSAWDLNMKALLNVLDAAREFGIAKVFVPSSIAVFGSDALKIHTPQHSHLDPETVYGISKVAAENWAFYYFNRYGLDVRSLRYPGVISYQSLPGGGTTDYAVDIFHKAVQGQHYECFLKPDTELPMIYINDAIRATLELMTAESEKIKVRTSYNLSGLSFTPEQLYQEIRKYYPNFKCSYKPDFRQAIADSWTSSIDDLEARMDWGWKPAYNLESMTKEMVHQLRKQQISAYSN